MSGSLPRSRLRLVDAIAVAGGSLAGRPLRAVLTAGGIAFGVAAMVAVLGVSSSSRAELLAQLDALGTNLLTADAGRTFLGTPMPLAPSAGAAARRLGDVEGASATAELPATVRRTDRVSPLQTGGLTVVAAEPSLSETVSGQLRGGRFLDGALAALPAVVLGDTAARRLGVDGLDARPLVWLGGEWFSVVGILEPLPLAPELDGAALIGFPAARLVLERAAREGTPLEEDSLAAGGVPRPTRLYVRTASDALDEVRDLLPATANPRSPEAVALSRPSDALAARAAADTTFTVLLLALGAVALVVGGLGIANIMVVAVLERRSEIGLRRALGATRPHVRVQFLLEAVLLSGAGGVTGVLLGTAITAVFARMRHLPFAIPPAALAAGVGLSLLVGALAGTYPAARAARLQPAEAVRGR